MLAPPKCFDRRCKHLTGVTPGDEATEKVCCKAFPKGIPDVIAYGDNLHLKPYPGDNGIQYEGEDNAPFEMPSDLDDYK